MKWGKAATGVFLGFWGLGSLWELSQCSFLIVPRDSVAAVRDLDSELVLIDVLGTASSWTQFPRLNAPSSEPTWLVYTTKTKLLLGSKVL